MADAVGFVCHPRVGTEDAPVDEARTWLRQRGYRVWTHQAVAVERPDALSANLNGTRLLVSVGGDGTLLWTAQQAARARVPVLGVNAGRLGFLTQVQLSEVTAALQRWASGDFELQARPLLEVHPPGDAQPLLALNDAVVHKAMNINLVRLEVAVNGEPAGQFDADGALISTGTGSTGYALSLGGPIVHPAARALVFTTLNPHTLFNRPVVLPESARVQFRVVQGSAVVSCDGQVSAEVPEGSVVEVAAAPLHVDFVRFTPERNFFDLLRQKLRWGLPLTDGE